MKQKNIGHTTLILVEYIRAKEYVL